MDSKYLVKYDYEIYALPQKHQEYNKEEYLKELYKQLSYGGMYVQNN